MTPLAPSPEPERVVDRRRNRIPRVIAHAACAVGAWLVHQRIPVHFFWGDDWAFLNGVRQLGLERLTEPVHWYFQPVSWRVYFVAMHALVGFDPVAFDLAQVVLLFAVGALAFEIVTHATRRPALGLLAVAYLARTAAFALVAGWASCIAYVLALLFELATLLVALRACADRRPPSVWLATAACVLFALSWLSKNSTLLFPLPLAVMLLAPIAERGRRVVEALLACTGLSIVYYALALAPHQPTASSGLFSVESLARTWSALVWRLPSTLDARFYGFLAPPLLDSWVACAVLRAALAVLALRAVLAMLRRRDAESATAVALASLAVVDVVLTAPVNLDRAIFQAQVAYPIAVAVLVSGAFPWRWRGLGGAWARRRIEPWLRALPSALAALVLVAAAARFEDPYVDAKREMLCQWRQLTQRMIDDPSVRPVVGRAPPERADWFPVMAEVFWGPFADTPLAQLPPADLDARTLGVRVGNSILRVPYGRAGVGCELPAPDTPSIVAASP
ncbi:MAG: hypothetical protein U0610_21185 [bacterium]